MALTLKDIIVETTGIRGQLVDRTTLDVLGARSFRKGMSARAAEDKEKRARAEVSCPTCSAAPGMWCRKVPDEQPPTMIVRTGKRWGQRRRVRCHEARIGKLALKDGLK